VGRDLACDIVLDIPKVSRRHLRVRLGPVVELEDLGSTNGTWVEGRRLSRGEVSVLRRGALIGLGPYLGVIVEGNTPQRPDCDR
jgi:pSer/pThr/pTyr-binding forkhead associated (FHA) protein